MHRTCALNLSYSPDVTNQTLDLITSQRQTYGTIAYVRGLQDHPLRETFPFVRKLERALDATDTPTPPRCESTSEEETWPDDDNYFGDSDDSSTPPY